MTLQPEALRLAEAMSFAFPGNLGIDKAAAELRRLHAENKVLHDRHHDGNVILTQMLAQRDALLEALKSTGLFLHHCWCDVQMNDHSFEKLNRQMEIVDAAIKAVEGEKA